MTHEYTILTGGVVICGADAPDATAIAWAHDTVLLIGSDVEVRAISRGDSHVIDLAGAFVAPVGESLETGGPADLAVFEQDPRTAKSPQEPLAIVRGGRTIAGQLDTVTKRRV